MRSETQLDWKVCDFRCKSCRKRRIRRAEDEWDSYQRREKVMVYSCTNCGCTWWEELEVIEMHPVLA